MLRFPSCRPDRRTALISLAMILVPSILFEAWTSPVSLVRPRELPLSIHIYLYVSMCRCRRFLPVSVCLYGYTVSISRSIPGLHGLRMDAGIFEILYIAERLRLFGVTFVLACVRPVSLCSFSTGQHQPVVQSTSWSWSTYYTSDSFILYSLLFRHYCLRGSGHYSKTCKSLQTGYLYTCVSTLICQLLSLHPRPGETGSQLQS